MRGHDERYTIEDWNWRQHGERYKSIAVSYRCIFRLYLTLYYYTIRTITRLTVPAYRSLLSAFMKTYRSV